MPGMKPGPDSVGIFAISQSCSGVAARVCSLVSLEPTKIVEILKDRPSWFRDCWSLEVFTMFPAGNGWTIELVYMQTFAPTTLAPARDFWTLRYTTSLENGSLVSIGVDLDGVRKDHQAIKAKLKTLETEKEAINTVIASLEEELHVVIQKRDNVYDKIRELRNKREEGNTCFYQNCSLLNDARRLAATKDVNALIKLSTS